VVASVGLQAVIRCACACVSSVCDNVFMCVRERKCVCVGGGKCRATSSNTDVCACVFLSICIHVFMCMWVCVCMYRLWQVYVCEQ